MAIQSMAAISIMATGNNRTLRSEKGFTLLELIIAVTLVAMMSGGIWSIFRTGIRSWALGTERIDTSQRHRNILDMVRKQMASAYPLTAPLDTDTSDMGTSVAGISVAVRPGIAYPIFTGTETSLRFISLNSLNFQDSPGLTLVNYDVVPGFQGDYSLVEREERYLGQLSAPENSDDVSGAIPLFENLSDCYFEYRSDESDDSSELWVREWDSQERGKLPVAVSLTMVSTGTNGNARKRNIFVPIHTTEGNAQMNVQNLPGIQGAFGRGRGRGPGMGPGMGPVDDARREILQEIEQRIRSEMGIVPGRGGGRGQGNRFEGGGDGGRGPGRGRGQ